MANTSKGQTSSSKSTNNQPINPQTQWHQQQQGPSSSNNSSSQQLSQSVNSTTEPYTLPGVINYLTSEFTNLERYKIMTNLEKSEMKYKIVQLQGELNSLKFANKKQKARIEALEEENNRLKGVKGEPSDAAGAASAADFVIPEVDLSIIRDSRQQLTKSMREIVNLLKTPGSKKLNYANLPDPDDSTNEFDVLVNNKREEQEEEEDNNVESLLFKELSVGKSRIAPNSMITQYFNDNKQEEEESDVRIPSPKFDDETNTSGMIYDDSLERVVTQDSETTIMDDPEEEEEEQEEVDIPGVISPFPSPEPELNSFNDTDYEILDVYDHNNITIYLNSMSDSNQIKLTCVRKSDNKIKLIKEFKLEILASNICNIFPISIEQEIFLIIDKQGEIKSLEINEVPNEYVLTKSTTFQTLESTDLIEFTSKTRENSKSFGLAITGTSATTGSFLVKIYQINYDTKLSSKEIGSYNKKFLTKGKNSEVSFIGWYVNDKPVTLDPPKGKSKNNNNVSSCDDIELSPYELLYKVDGKTIELNIVSKQSSYLLT
ncbi:hypothetical protein JA1_003781 [Spathaspora sp. JA1]|nr:hypothetical protein JA1_003781 [Spathaspora sp. JA1]